MALLGLLLLRGPQTLAELRARAERWYAFGSVEEVEQEMGVLLDRDLAVRLDRQPGRKESRYAQVLAASGTAPVAPAPAAPGAPGATPAAPLPFASAEAPSSATVGSAGLAEDVAALREEVASLRAEVARLSELID